MNFQAERKPNGPYLASWKVKKFESFPKHPWWLFALFVIAILLLIYSLATDNFLLSLIVILAGIIAYLFEKKEPETYHFAICETGIIAHNKFYDFTEIEDFWIFYEAGEMARKELSLRTESRFLPYIHIPLGQQDPNEVRKILSRFLVEDIHRESLWDHLEHIL